MKNVHTVLHKIFDDAIDRNFAVNNPAHKVKIEGGRDSVERVMPDPSDVEKTFANLARPIRFCCSLMHSPVYVAASFSDCAGRMSN
jgi:hypothetical protein